MIIIGETKVILNEGMPQYKNIDNRGRLIVEFKVHTYNINKHTHMCMLCLMLFYHILKILRDKKLASW